MLKNTISTYAKDFSWKKWPIFTTFMVPSRVSKLFIKFPNEGIKIPISTLRFPSMFLKIHYL